MRKSAAGGVAAGALALFFATPMLVFLAEPQTQDDCAAGLAPSGGSGSWAADQLTDARAIWAVAHQMDLGDQGAIVGIATALQESGLHNISHGDAAGPDSRGLFQQRVSWGPLAVRMDPVGASQLFFHALERVPGWRQLPVTVAAQRVQVSAFPEAYAQWVPDATTLVGKMSGQAVGSCAGTTGGGPVPANWNQLNPRTVTQAITWMTSQPDGAPGEPVHGACERYMNLSYGLGAGYPTAKAHWLAAGEKHTTGVPPQGALVFIQSRNPDWHVVLSVGNGQAVSTDFQNGRYTPDKVGTGSIAAIAQAMGGPVLGWRPPAFPSSS